MAFDRVPYLEWAHRRPRADINLAFSGMGPTEELLSDWKGMSFNGPNEYGYLPLLELIAARYGVRPENVVTASGTSMANFLVFAALLRPGDEVIVERPCYGPLLDIPRALGARLKRIPRRLREGFRIDPDAVERLCSKKTRLVVITNPHNPSGVLTREPDLLALKRLAHRFDFHVLVDEVYLDFLTASPASSAVLGRRFISTNSLTKVYGLSGLRCGWILADERMARRFWRVRDYMDVNGSFPSEEIARRIFPQLPEILARSRNVAEAGLRIVSKFIAGNPALAWVAPDGGIICFPQLDSSIPSSQFFARLLNQYDTLVVPGRFFEARRNFRLGFGIPEPVLRTGLNNIRKTIQDLAPSSRARSG